MKDFRNRQTMMMRSPVKKNTNIKPYWKTIETIINKADIILEIIDARLPEISRNVNLEEMIEKHGKKKIFIVNKSDLVSKEVVEKVTKELNDISPAIFVSSTNKLGFKLLRSKIYQLAYEINKTKDSKESKYKSKIVVGVVGYPNVGKSSVINALAFSKKAPVSAKAGTTHGEQKINITEKIQVLDSPGVIPVLEQDEIRHGLIGARNPNKINNLERLAETIIAMFLKHNKKAMEDFYKIKIESTETYEILLEIGRKKGHLKKGGEVEENRTSTAIIDDWQKGKLKL